MRPYFPALSPVVGVGGQQRDDIVSLLGAAGWCIAAGPGESGSALLGRKLPVGADCAWNWQISLDLGCMRAGTEVGISTDGGMYGYFSEGKPPIQPRGFPLLWKKVRIKHDTAIECQRFFAGASLRG